MAARLEALRRSRDAYGWLWRCWVCCWHFGRYNPLYLALAELPGFNLFRAPARFLALFTLALALLSGCGVAALQARLTGGFPRRKVWLILVFIGGLILAARFVLPVDPADFLGDSAITGRALGLWLLAWLLLLALLHWRSRWTAFAAFLLITGELLLASNDMPYTDLAPPEVYIGQAFQHQPAAGVSSG